MCSTPTARKWPPTPAPATWPTSAGSPTRRRRTPSRCETWATRITPAPWATIDRSIHSQSPLQPQRQRHHQHDVADQPCRQGEGGHARHHAEPAVRLAVPLAHILVAVIDQMRRVDAPADDQLPLKTTVLEANLQVIWLWVSISPEGPRREAVRRSVARDGANLLHPAAIGEYAVHWHNVDDLP